MSRLRANEITNRMANGAPTVSNGLVISGVTTAGSGIRLGATGSSTLISGTGTGIGIGTITPNSLITIQDTGDTSIRFKNSSSVDKAFVGTSGAFGSAGTDDLRIRSDASNIVFGFNGAERLRIGNSGQIGLGGANYGSSGQVLTSQGSGSAVQWATPSTSTDPTTGVANNNIWQTVGSNISWHTNYNNTDNAIGSVSNCNQSNVYAIDVKIRLVFNNSGGTYNYNNTHGYLVGYAYQDGKNYFDKGVYTEAQHFDLYYNVFGTVYTIPWDPSGTQNLKMYCTYAYNTSTQNYFNFQVINKWTR